MNEDASGSEPAAKRLALNKQKLSVVHGHGSQIKKSAFQRQKEEMEERRKKEEEERARLYSEFVTSFGDEEAYAHDKTFVRGGTVRPGQRGDRGGRDGGDRDNGSDSRIFRPMDSLPGLKRAHEADGPAPAYQPEMPTTSGNPAKKRKMDELLETFKRNNEAQGSSSYSSNRHHRSNNNSQDQLSLPFSALSTNVYVGNLSRAVDEPLLQREFGQFGPIASIKIMWPRTKEEQNRGHNSGFVCFMDRGSAQRAYNAMNGRDLLGHPLRLDWGKPVPLPSRPMYVDPKWRSDHDSARRRGSGSASDEIVVRVPDDPSVRVLIHQTVERVLEWGHAFEQLLMAKNKDNPSFLFVHDVHHPDHHYYKWRVWSLLQGDSTTVWSTKPFHMVRGGPRWIPPPCLGADDDIADGELDSPAAIAAAAAEILESDDDLDEELSAAAKSASVRVIRRLRALCRATLASGDRKPSRGAIARIMALVIAASDAASDVSMELARLATRPRAPPHWQLHVLYLVHDVLHNCTAPVNNAWRYREAIQAHLPRVFKHFGGTYAAMRGEGGARWAADAWRNNVLAVVSVWRQWMLFPRPFLADLEAAVRPNLVDLDELHAAAAVEEEEAARQAAECAKAAAEAAALAAASAAQGTAVVVNAAPRGFVAVENTATSSANGGDAQDSADSAAAPRPATLGISFSLAKPGANLSRR
ncbi:hypothetical protein H9P43_004272 [Blastocladiella emersonii ATCC 22665]|nr:hypothetical protein H9P43_004272 [Blastocladiella emersonii ATCC 22665]